jgi:signal transduction histidine kinase
MTLGKLLAKTEPENATRIQKANYFLRRRGFFWEARTRILIWYSLLMAGFIGLSIPIFTQMVFREVDARGRGDLVEEMESFELFLKQKTDEGKTDLPDIFQNFMYRQLPEDDNFLIAIVGGRFDRSSPRGRPKILDEKSELMLHWAKLTQAEAGERKTTDPKIGSIIYRAEPVRINGKLQGVFVVVHTTAGEIREATAQIGIVVKVLLAVLVLAVVFAWIVSGRILAPLRSLLSISRSINEADFKARVPVQGSGEMAELAGTFNAMLDRLQDAFTSQQSFINDAGHELRTPITIIRGHLELIGDDPQEQQETLELVLDELDRMSRLVDDLLLIAKSERPDFLQLETLDIGILTQELYAKARALGDRNWQLAAQAKGKFIADRHRLTQAIVNLVSNAAQHTKASDTITLGSAIAKDSIRFWVKDTGVGIAESDQKRIFERFARASHSYRNSDGSGLGLSIVKAIVEAHGGRVELRSELGTGSTFTIVLPLKLFRGL